MKKMTTLLVVMAALFVMSGKAQAVTMYYTFEGTVTGASDAAGAVDNAGLSVGSTVTYTFLVDLDADGAITLNNGADFNYTDSAYADFLYSDYVSGDALEQIDGGIYDSGYSIAEYNLGYELSDVDFGYLIGNSQDDLLLLYSYLGVSDWAEGDTIYGYNYAFDSNGAFSYLYANLTLTDISPVSVPEPSTLLLFGAGMLGLIAFRRRQLATQT